MDFVDYQLAQEDCSTLMLLFSTSVGGDANSTHCTGLLWGLTQLMLVQCLSGNSRLLEWHGLGLEATRRALGPWVWSGQTPADNTLCKTRASRCSPECVLGSPCPGSAHHQLLWEPGHVVPSQPEVHQPSGFGSSFTSVGIELCTC